jgi:chloramphenicol-sensitive protein RarD
MSARPDHTAAAAVPLDPAPFPHLSRKPASGLPMALGAYIAWGFLPLYLRLLQEVPALELVGWRVIFTLPFCLAIVALRGQTGEVLAALRNPAILVRLLASAAFIAFNWLVYIAAVNGGHIYAASLGYYINPLVNILLGTVFLKERLSRTQWFAVGLAALGVALLLGGAHDTLWISLALALSFSFYGLIRKLTPVGAVPGLTVESLLLLIPAIATVAWFGSTPAGSSFGVDQTTSALLVGAGVLTAVPLLLFAVAARRLEYSLLGFVQFLSPTIAFVLGLTVFGEILRPVQLGCFILIWAAIAVFSGDLLSRRKPG